MGVSLYASGCGVDVEGSGSAAEFGADCGSVVE